MWAASCRRTLSIQPPFCNVTNRRLPPVPLQGVDVGSILPEDTRQQLYRAEVLARLSDGTGDFNAERMLQVLLQWGGWVGGWCGCLLLPQHLEQLNSGSTKPTTGELTFRRPPELLALPAGAAGAAEH